MPFIVGVPRSGTTLLRFMLDSHPELAIPPETGFVPDCARLRGSGEALRRRFVAFITAYPAEAPNWADFGIPVVDLNGALDSEVPFTTTGGLRAFYRLYAARHGKRRWGDKTPPYGLEMPTIERLLPEARFIHVIRDGRAVAASWRGTWFAPSSEIAKLAAAWRRWIERARRDARRVRHYLEVRYEDLVIDPASVLQRIAAYCVLDYDPRMLEYHQRTPARLDEHHARVGAGGEVVISRDTRLWQQQRTTQPPDSGRIGAWRGVLTEREKADFARVAGELAMELGYRD
jgi:hypothetical protein